MYLLPDVVLKTLFHKAFNLGTLKVFLQAKRPPLTFLPELVIDKPLLGVAEHLVGLSNLFELFLGIGLGVLVRVEAQCHASIGLLDVFLTGALGDAQDLVVVFPHGCMHLEALLHSHCGGGDTIVTFYSAGSPLRFFSPGGKEGVNRYMGELKMIFESPSII